METENKPEIPTVGSNDGLCAWVQKTTDALKEAGFTVEDYQGFPLVKMPEDFAGTLKLFKFRLPFGGTMTMYAQGALITPGRVCT